jgi:hypothetical protein
MALGHSGEARLLLAVVLAPLTMRLCGYRQDGTTRPWPSALSPGRRGLAPALLVAAALTLSYSASHAFTQDGGAGVPPPRLFPGQTAVLTVGLHGLALPAQVTAVGLDGRGADAVVVTRAALTSGQTPPLLFGGPTGPIAHGLPVRIPAQTGVWLAIRVRLRTCPARAARIDAITLRYRALGIATSERIPLWSVVRFACRGSSLDRSLLSD